MEQQEQRIQAMPSTGVIATIPDELPPFKNICSLKNIWLLWAEGFGSFPVGVSTLPVNKIQVIQH